MRPKRAAAWLELMDRREEGAVHKFGRSGWQCYQQARRLINIFTDAQQTANFRHLCLRKTRQCGVVTVMKE
ncbi:hypothetical protein C1N64_11070 [Pantoea sp. SGAir0215]